MIILLRLFYKIAVYLVFLSVFSLYAYGLDDREMTAADVYDMIEDYGFYCEIIRGSGFHGEGLRGKQVPNDFIFKGKREITVIAKKKDFLETKSVPLEKNINQEEIVLGWPRETKNQCTFQTLEAHIKILNQKNTDKSKKWRIPTIMELFSIIQKKPKNHFPKAIKLPEKKTLTFWTSTPVKKEGTFLEYDKDNKAYFVVQSSFKPTPTGKDYSLSFEFRNIKPEDQEEAILLPVLSDKVYTYTAASPQKKAPATQTSKGSNKIPGFDDYVASPTAPPKTTSPVTIKPRQQPAADIIPGFDDVPVVSPAAITTQNTSSSIKISLFPHLMGDTADDNRKDLLNHLNDLVKPDIEALKTELELKFNYDLIVDKMDPFNKKDMDKISRLYFFVSDGNLSKPEKISQIKEQIMIPLGIHIILTIKYSIEKSSGIENIEPIVIDGLNDQIDKATVLQNEKEQQRYHKLRKEVNRLTRKIFFNNSKK